MKIAEVSEQYGISPDTLRYYERIGLILPVNRNKNGIRDYNEMDVKRIEFVRRMRSAGLSIEALSQYMGLLQQGVETFEARKKILTAQRDLLVLRMEEMQKSLDMLNFKIRIYENAELGKDLKIAKEKSQ
ncbi:MAG: MerR family transcriptional regulator [Anaerolineae bacterium]|nr:MerR family transcriptional regulator [Anaerolineae bacterium]